MQFRKLKRLANELKIDVDEPTYCFGEWQLCYDAQWGYSFNNQFSGSVVCVDDPAFDQYGNPCKRLTKGEVIEKAWEQIKYDATDIVETDEKTE